MHDDARILRELIFRERLNAGWRDRAIAKDVLLEVVGRAEIVIVRIQPIGDAAEAAKHLEPADDAGLDAVPGALDLAAVGGLVSKCRELFVDRFLEFVGRVTGPRRGLDLEDRAENQRLLLR